MHLARLSAPVVSAAVRRHPTRSRRRLVVPVAVAMAVVAGCSTDTPSSGELTDALVDSGLSEEVASCTAEAVLDTLSDDEVRLLVERGAGGAPQDDPDDDDDSADRLRLALDECRALLAEEQPAPTTEVTPSTDVAPTTEATATTEAPPTTEAP